LPDKDIIAWGEDIAEQGGARWYVFLNSAPAKLIPMNEEEGETLVFNLKKIVTGDM
jgi:hypothetical protein